MELGILLLIGVWAGLMFDADFLGAPTRLWLQCILAAAIAIMAVLL